MVAHAAAPLSSQASQTFPALSRSADSRLGRAAVANGHVRAERLAAERNIQRILRFVQQPRACTPIVNAPDRCRAAATPCAARQELERTANQPLRREVYAVRTLIRTAKRLCAAGVRPALAGRPHAGGMGFGARAIRRHLCRR